MDSNTISRIRIFCTSERQVRCYAISQRLTLPDMNGEHTYNLSDIEKLENGSDTFTTSAEVRKTVVDLLKVNGIICILVRPFEINIKIAYVFDWEDVHKEIIRIIETQLFVDREVDVQNRTEMVKSDSLA